MSDNDETLATLSKDICDAVNDFVANAEYKVGAPSLTISDPQRAQEVLMLLATGTSGNKIIQSTGCGYSVQARLKSDFADYLGQWKEVGGTLAGGVYIHASDGISDTMERLAKAEEENDHKTIEVLSKSLLAKNKVAEVSHRQATVARGDVTDRVSRVEEKPDFEEMMKAVAEMHKEKQAEVIDVE